RSLELRGTSVVGHVYLELQRSVLVYTPYYLNGVINALVAGHIESDENNINRALLPLGQQRVNGATSFRVPYCAPLGHLTHRLAFADVGKKAALHCPNHRTYILGLA